MRAVGFIAVLVVALYCTGAATLSFVLTRDVIAHPNRIHWRLYAISAAASWAILYVATRP